MQAAAAFTVGDTWNSIETVHKLFLVAAYEDSRSGSHQIRILVFCHRDVSPLIYCKYGQHSYLARGRWIHYTNRTLAVWRAASAICSRPTAWSLSKVVLGSLTTTQNDIVLPVHGPLPKIKRFLGVCVKSGYGSPDHIRFVEWMELNRLLGVDHVFIYNASMSGPIDVAFNYYTSLGMLTVIEDITRAELERREPQLKDRFRNFDATFSTGSEPHPQTQLLSLHDCFYRFRYLFEYIMVIDIDEVIVPTKVSTLVELLKLLKIKYPSSTAFSFSAAEYVEQFGQSNLLADNLIHSLKFTRRTQQSFEQVKTVYSTADTILLNWHKRLHPTTNFTAVSKEYGWLHHYRATCKSRSCKAGYYADDGLQKLGRYATVLTSNVHTAMQSINVSA